MKVLIFIMISGVLLGIVEILKRKFVLSTSVTRRVSHIGATIIAAASPLFVSKTIIVFVCFSFAVVVLFCRKTKLLSSIHDVTRSSYGDVLLPIGEAITAILFLPTNILAFQFGVLVMGISDAFAGFIGERYGSKKFFFFGLTKSIEGSLTFFVTTLVIITIFKGSIDINTIIVALILTFAEGVGIYGSDNLILPILGAYLYLNYL